jgi:putative FmdB family regulatory protein
MPNYKYKCTKCEYDCTVVQNINEDIKTPECPDCKEAMERVFGALAVQFRGGGWGSSRG